MLLGGIVCTSTFGSAAIHTITTFGGVSLRVAVAAATGLYLLAQGVAHLVRPLVLLGEDVLEIRTSPWRRAQVVAPWDVAWRAGATYVGRYLSFRAEGGRQRRFPLWMLTRRDQRVLFAWLDAHHADGVRAAGTARGDRSAPRGKRPA
jgi:hypothetical protein